MKGPERETTGCWLTALVLMEIVPILPNRSELLYGIVTIVIGILLVAVIGLAVLLMVQHYRRQQAHMSALEERLAALEQAPGDRAES